MSSRDGTAAPALQTLFKRVPSIRDRTRRASLGQISGTLAIHNAVAKGKIHLAKFILDAVEGQPLVDARDAHGKTPLIRAMRVSDAETRNKVVDLLISYKASVNLVDHVGRSALSYACELHCNGVIRKLVRNNVDPNSEDHNGNTPLMYCALANNAEAIEIISRSFRRLGLEVDKVNADGMTPLMEAAKNGYIDCARLLALEAKASVVIRDEVRNMNAAEWAREAGCSTSEVEVLLPKQPYTEKMTEKGLLSHCQTKTIATKNGALASQRDVHITSVVEDLLSHGLTPLSLCTTSDSSLTLETGNGAVSRQHFTYMDELVCRSKELLLENRSHDLPATGFSFPDVHGVGKQHPAGHEHHQFPLFDKDVQDNSPTLSKGISPSSTSRGGLFTRRPQPPAAPMRPCSAAAQKPHRRVRGHAGQTSSSMEDLLLMADPTEPIIRSSSQSPLKSSSMSRLTYQRGDASELGSPRFDKRSIESDTHIDLTILPSTLSGRLRTSSQPLPNTDPYIISDNSASVSCTHLPPISPKFDH
ncbi:uncharacterized protein LOC110989933 [Acanthaster planci]|uniref:Uncharacterized protein LOC110989933 n=1 Tax=Acanthaster planci TaxID=133434 RepID=A0A8B7ZY45_ACAPL|nr:uncharacterized protein LOC110989933 [Acanthaster planci]XP_022110339.1 uncharacterized protein LOC110989933 [Acanthaster planci]